MNKPLFIYTGKTALSKKQAKALEDAGYVVIRVNSMDDIRIENQNDITPRERMLLDAAMYAVNSSGFTSTKDKMGRFLAHKLTKNQTYPVQIKDGQ